MLLHDSTALFSEHCLGVEGIKLPSTPTKQLFSLVKLTRSSALTSSFKRSQRSIPLSCRLRRLSLSLICLTPSRSFATRSPYCLIILSVKLSILIPMKRHKFPYLNYFLPLYSLYKEFPPVITVAPRFGVPITWVEFKVHKVKFIAIIYTRSSVNVILSSLVHKIKMAPIYTTWLYIVLRDSSAPN